MAERLDIFKTLAAANRKDTAFFTKLTPEEQKTYFPIVVTRWMSGTSDKLQVVTINEFLNPYVFSLYKHPSLLWNLTTVVNSGKSRKYNWIKNAGKAEASALSIQVIMEYYKLSAREATESIKLLSAEVIVEMATEMGWQSDELTKLKKELK